MAPPVTAQTSEQGAREYWAKMAHAKLPADRHARRFVASDELSKAVAALLSEKDVNLTSDHIRADPAAGVEVMALAGQHADGPIVIPIVPASAELRLYRPADTEAPAEAVGDLVATVSIPENEIERDGWVPAAAIVEQLLIVLAPAES